MAKRNDDGLFDEPCRHRSVYRNEHEIICNDCGATVSRAPH